MCQADQTTELPQEVRTLVDHCLREPRCLPRPDHATATQVMITSGRHPIHITAGLPWRLTTLRNALLPRYIVRSTSRWRVRVSPPPPPTFWAADPYI